jgi:hypothetical protein
LSVVRGKWSVAGDFFTILELILKETKGLPPFALNEVLDFILFIKGKRLKKLFKLLIFPNYMLES